MSLEIPNGSIVADKYKIIKTLGQGGFGRAYLAEDKGRFNEQCVLKEFAPDIEPQYWNKAKELFDQECRQLYQLAHDQIPTFTEILTAKVQNYSYVFLVQSYVRGLSYDAIVQKYGVLNEGQIIRFLQEILPVLTYIHDQELVHRDISPDNIICRFVDQKPVLIDFGLVRDVSTKYTQMAFTPAGKQWFSPYEQINGQNASPSSDLYALAATVLFLLTDRKFTEFYTPRSGKWEFKRQVNISARLSDILTKMLEFRPIDRYQTAAEVCKAISLLPYIATVAILIDPNDLSPIPPSMPDDCTSVISNGRRLTSSVLSLCRSHPLSLVVSGLGALFAISLIFNGIGQTIKDTREMQFNPNTRSIEPSSANINSCLDINDRLKTAKISEQTVNQRYRQKYPDRLKKTINPRNVRDRQLRAEWCQVAEQLIVN